jgi:hypothetical protein
VESSRRRIGFRALAATGCALLAAAIGVRSIPPARAALPKDKVDEKPHLAEPMQLLGRGASLRAPELDRWVSEPSRTQFKLVRQSAFAIQGCPPLRDWIDGPQGQRFERALADLRNGTREDAFASLVLVFQLARSTEWAPGIVARGSEHAERLGALLQDWLRVWGERAARDPLLADPALAAVLLYGRAMRAAWKAPLLSNNQAPFERARAFLGELTGIEGSRRTGFGEALRARYARAAEKLLAKSDPLLGLEEEAAAQFPDLAGTCG